MNQKLNIKYLVTSRFHIPLVVWAQSKQEARKLYLQRCEGAIAIRVDFMTSVGQIGCAHGQV